MAMCLRWALPLVLAIVVLALRPAEAQFGGMPGMPGSPGFGAPPAQQGPPPECQQLLTLRDQTEKHGKALEAAGKRKAPPDQSCKLFKAFLAAEMRLIMGLERLGPRCGVPSGVPKQVRASHVKAEAVAQKLCEMAAQPPRPTGPTLSEALGATPTVPDSSSSKRGMGTFDTLSGSPLAR
jgi:hypothetical protein